jgi:hypothetical protein
MFILSLIFVIACGFCEWFDAGFSLSFVYICIAVGDQVKKRGKLGSINPATLYNCSKSGLFVETQSLDFQ